METQRRRLIDKRTRVKIHDQNNLSLSDGIEVDERSIRGVDPIPPSVVPAWHYSSHAANG